MPLPMVVATAVPVKAPTMLSTPAIRTAVLGFNTLVATEVAMAFAVSWKPLMKSKARPMTTIRMSMRSAGLGILHHDPFQGVGNILGAVGSILEVLVDLSPTDALDQAANIIHVVKLAHERLVEHVVGLVLKPLNVDCAVQHMVPLFAVFQVRYGAGDEFCLVIDNAGQQAGMFCCLIHAIKPGSTDGLLNGIDKVVKPAGEVRD